MHPAICPNVDIIGVAKEVSAYIFIDPWAHHRADTEASADNPIQFCSPDPHY